jgi:hypothetical protein
VVMLLAHVHMVTNLRADKKLNGKVCVCVGRCKRLETFRVSTHIERSYESTRRRLIQNLGRV